MPVERAPHLQHDIFLEVRVFHGVMCARAGGDVAPPRRIKVRSLGLLLDIDFCLHACGTLPFVELNLLYLGCAVHES
jgi:hypothetical protein